LLVHSVESMMMHGLANPIKKLGFWTSGSNGHKNTF